MTRTPLTAGQLALLAGMTLAWGLNWGAMKVGLEEMAPLSFRSLSFVIGVLLLFLAVRVAGQPLTIPRGQWKRLVLLALVNVTAWNVLVVYALTMLPAGRAAIVAYTMPAWAILFSAWILGERPGGRKLAALALGMAGVALLLVDEIGELSRSPLGTGLVLAAAAFWGLGTVLQTKLRVEAPLGAYSAWILLLGGVPVVVLALAFEAGRPIELGPRGWAALLYNGAIAVAFAYWAWIRLATSLPVAFFALANLLTPVIGVLSGMLMLGETPAQADISALVLVLASLALAMGSGEAARRRNA